MARLLPILTVVLALALCYASAKSVKSVKNVNSVKKEKEMKNEVREVLRELVDLLLRDEQEIRADKLCTDFNDSAPTNGAFSYSVMNGAMTAQCTCTNGFFDNSDCNYASS